MIHSLTHVSQLYLLSDLEHIIAVPIPRWHQRKSTETTTTKKMATTIQSDIRSALQVATSTILSRRGGGTFRAVAVCSFPNRRTKSSSSSSLRLRAFFSSSSSNDAVLKSQEKPPICTADELHYVPVSNSDWKLALWRYRPSPQVC